MLFIMKLSIDGFFPNFEKKALLFYVLYGTSQELMNGLLREVEMQYPSKRLEEEKALEQWDTLWQPSLWEPLSCMILTNATGRSFPLLLQHTPPYPTIVLVKNNPQALVINPQVGCVACYEATPQESSRVLQRWVNRFSLSLDSEAMKIAAQNSTQGQWPQWCETLSMYGEERISMALFQELIQLPRHPLESYILYPEKKLPANIVDPLKVLRSWQRLTSQALQLLSLSKKHGLPPERVLSQVKPPIFFKQAALLLQAVKNTPPAIWSKLLQNLLQGEVDLKTTPIHGDAILEICRRH